MEGSSPALTQRVRTGLVGAAIVPHAPQFLTLPETEDLAQVERVRVAMQAVGDGLRALDPDLVIVISNAHGEDLVVSCVPPFMVHCGDRAEGSGKHKGAWSVDGEAGYALTRLMLDEGFDVAFSLDAALGTAHTIPLEFCGYPRDVKFLPIFVNAYVPPQPRPERCFAFGRALARSLERMGRRAVILASDGLSHYPGTPMYPTPDLATDRVIFERLAAGNLHYLMSFDERRLDESGNVELRGLQILAGAIGHDLKPDSALFEPSWHHIYAVLGWTQGLAGEAYTPLYNATASASATLAKALNAIVTDAGARAAYLGDRASFAARFALAEDAAAALSRLDEDELRERFAIHPMLTYQAKLRTGMPLKHNTRPA